MYLRAAVGGARRRDRAGFIKETDQINAMQNGPVSQTTLQQESASANSTGSSSERSASLPGEISAQPKVGGSVGGTEGSSSGFSNEGRTTVAQALDPAARCNAMALDRQAAITNANAIAKLDGMKVTVLQGGRATTETLDRASAIAIVQGISRFARQQGAWTPRRLSRRIESNGQPRRAEDCRR